MEGDIFCFFSAPAALPFSPHRLKALLKIGKGNTLCICYVLAFEAFCPAGKVCPRKVCAFRSAKPWMFNIFTVFSVFSHFLFLVKSSSQASPLQKKIEAGRSSKQLQFKFSFYMCSVETLINKLEKDLCISLLQFACVSVCSQIYTSQNVCFPLSLCVHIHTCPYQHKIDVLTS